jgi:uncharacterized protein
MRIEFEWDPEKAEAKERFVGQSEAGRLLAVMHMERGEKIRLISARVATPKERRQYAEGDSQAP